MSKDTDVHYYVCVSSDGTEHCGDPLTVTVTKTETPEEPEEETPKPEEPAIDNGTGRLLVYSVSVSPDTVNGGDTVNLRFAIQNDGTVSLRGTVHIYRHDTKTNTPSTGGEQVHTTELGVAPKGEKRRSATPRTPEVSENTDVHFYVCVDGHCGDPVTVTVRKTEVPAEETPEPEGACCEGGGG